MLRVWRNELVLAVIDAATGKPTMVGPLNDLEPLSRSFPNTPFAYFFPDEDLVILNWQKVEAEVQTEVRETRRKQKERKQPVENLHELTMKVWMRRLEAAVSYEGKDYYGTYGWGSAAKEKQTLGLVKDLLYESRLFPSDAHYPYASRCLIPNGLYGAGIFEGIKILLLPAGAVFAGHKCGDGVGFVANEDVELMRSEQPDITLDKVASQSYLSWQRMPWSLIEKEVKPLIKENLEQLGTRDWETVVMDESESSAYKRALVDAEPKMRMHPYVAHHLKDSLGRYLAECATTVPLPGVTRVAVPSMGDDYVLPIGEHLVIRWPVDNWSSIQAIENTERTPEHDRIEKIATVQYTLTNPDKLFAKGMAIRIPKKDMKGYDLVLCCEDVKAMKSGLYKMRERARQNGQTTFSSREHFVFTITQSFAPGTAVGCPEEHWKKYFGGDFDGDFAAVFDASRVPSVQAVVNAFPEVDTFKIKKEYGRISNRSRMLWSSMHMMTGFAVNLVSSTFVVQPEDRWQVAQLLGFSTQEELDIWCNRAIKVMTDGFKSSKIDLNNWRSGMAAKQSKIANKNAFGGVAPWPRWGRSKWAFRHGLPKFHSELPKDYREFVESEYGANHRREDEWRAHIPDSMYSSTIAQLYVYARPFIEPYFDAKTGRFKLKDYIRIKPLSDFVIWANPVTEDDMVKGWALKEEWDEAVTRVNWLDMKHAVPAFKETWRRRCDKWAKQFESRRYACQVAWRAMHHARSTYASAAGVFTGFPDESMWVVTEKPGLSQQNIKTLVTGVNYNASETQRSYPAQLVDIIEDDRGTEVRLVVLSVDGRFPFLLSVTSDGRMRNQIGTIGKIEKSHEREGLQAPGVGRYLATFKMWGNSKGTYEVKLHRVDEQ